MFILADGPIIWSSKKKSEIALSSTEEKYRGTMNVDTQCSWLHGILGQLGIEYETSTTIYCENKSTSCISIDPVLRQLSKHIENHMHYIRGRVHGGVISLLYCTSSEQILDVFTKVFSENTFRNIKSLLWIYDNVVKTN